MRIPVQPLNIASLGAFVSFAIFLMFLVLGFDPLGAISWFGAWVIVVVITMSIKRHRDGGLDGIITYGQALSIGLMATLVYASLFGILIYVFGTFIHPSLVEIHVEYMKYTMQTFFDYFGEQKSGDILGVEDTGISEVMKLLEEQTMTSMALDDFQMKVWGGVIVSLICAGILKQSEEDFEYE